MSVTKLMEDLGIDPNPTDTEPTEEIENTDPESQDKLTDSEPKGEEKPDSENTATDTEPASMDDDKFADLQKQIEVMQKRIDDKDDYINQLREESKSREENKQENREENAQQEENSFWEDPEKVIGDLQNTIKLQQMQIQETIYANTVDDYWKTVNPQALQEAVAGDQEFAQNFNNSTEPYKVAYEYLTEQKAAKMQSENALREQIRKELMNEMGVQERKKEVPPTVNTGKSSSTTANKAPEDGFAAVFGGQPN